MRERFTVNDALGAREKPIGPARVCTDAQELAARSTHSQAGCAQTCSDKASCSEKGVARVRRPRRRPTPR